MITYWKIIKLVIALTVLAHCGTSTCPPGIEEKADHLQIARSGEVKKIKEIWETVRIGETPRIYPAGSMKYEGLTGIYFQGLPYKGNETRVFAWYGIPASKDGKKVPAMILVHGGNGTAYPKWVRMWNEKGYAAIAIDTNGNEPIRDGEGEGLRKPHMWPGPARWGGFEQTEEDSRDHWATHGVADIMLARKLIGSLPGVDPEKIGITGISWGAYLALIATSVDPGIKCVIPVYGSGFLGEDSAWTERLKELGEKGKKWIMTWDASVYLGAIKVPSLWLSGVNDPYFSLPSFRKSGPLTQPKGIMCLRLKMPHSQLHGRKPVEIAAFAGHVLNGAPPLPQILEEGRENCEAWVKYDSPFPVTSALFFHTTDTGAWKNRKWHTKKASLDQGTRKANAKIPHDATAYFINVVDERKLMVSSRIHELKRK